MIYVFAGTDSEKRQAAVSSLLEKYSEASSFRFDDLNKNPGDLYNLIGGDDLFAEMRLVIIDKLLETDFGMQVLEHLSKLSESKNIFVIIENSLGKDTVKALEKEAKDVRVFDLPKVKDDRFNIFQITDAFGARDKKNSWVLMQKALRQDIAPEEILNILIWQVKNLLLTKGAKSMKETGLSPFVHDKSLKYSNNFEAKELQGISRNLAKLYHESHLGLDLGPNLELFLLKTL